MRRRRNDGDDLPPLEAPFSYGVRYHRPAEDERAFVERQEPLFLTLRGAPLREAYRGRV